MECLRKAYVERPPAGPRSYTEKVSRLSPCVLALAVLLAGPSSGRAQEPEGWTLHLSGDRAGISLFDAPDTWWTGRAQIGFRREGRGGAFAAVEGYRRFDLADTTFVAAGWRHVRKWSFYGEGGFTPDAEFHYRHSVEAEVFRQLGDHPWVPHLGYRFYRWSDGQALHLFSPRVTRYGARSEIHARLILVQSATEGGSTALFARGQYDLRPRLRVGGGFAKGERIFDVVSLPRDPAPGWAVFGDARLAVTSRDALGIVVRAAEEAEDFDLAAVTLTYRRTF